MSRPAPKMRLANIPRGPRVPVTVAEWDATPGLHKWIEGEIRRREEVARSHGEAPLWEYDPAFSMVRDAEAGSAVARVFLDGTGDHIMLNDPDAVLRRCAADRKILAAHPYIDAPRSSRKGPPFACETCHVDDGYVSGGGNCDTVLALAEAYGLEPAGDEDVEVVQG